MIVYCYYMYSMGLFFCDKFFLILVEQESEAFTCEAITFEKDFRGLFLFKIIIQFKKISSLRGTKESSITCVLLPLTSDIPTYLAQVLLQTCDPSFQKLDASVENPLQNTTYLYSKTLNKYISFVYPQFHDFFGCLDLCQIADWIIILVPSDISLLTRVSYELLTAVYSQGFSSVSYAVMSSIADIKELKRGLEVGVI